MSNYSKSDLVRILAAQAGIPQPTAKTVVDGLFAQITERTAAGDKVIIAGFGKFEQKTRAARTGRNPATGASLEIPERNVLKFTPSKPTT
jgi:nucleoid DNA-binding protein